MDELIVLISVIYISSISILSMIITVYDKYAAIHRRRRISEKSLFLLSVFGGSLVMYFTMLFIRHKTRHKRFMIGIPIIIIIQVFIVMLTRSCL